MSMKQYLLFSSSLIFFVVSSKAQFYSETGSKIYTGNGGIITANNTGFLLNGDVTGSNNGKLVCNGNTAQTIDANGYSVYGLEIDNSAGITLSSNLQVSNQLTLSNGIIATGDNILYIPSTASVSRQNGWVNGFFKKYIKAGSDVQADFEVGDADYYTPASFTFSTVTAAGDITASAVSGAGSENHYSSFPLSKTNYINRYWKLSQDNAFSFSNYSATLNYVSADKTGSVDVSSLKAGVYNSGWNTYTTSAGTNSNTATNISALGNIILANEDAVVQYTITSSAGANGSISPGGTTYVNSGGSQTFTITPNTDYAVSDVLVDGVSVGAVSSYTFSDVTANHTITASFVSNCSIIPATPKYITISKRFNTCGDTITCSIKTVANSSSYTWTVPAGTAIISGQGTTTIQLSVSDTFGNGRVYVSAANSCGGSSDKQSALIYGRPIQPIISGPECVSSNTTGLIYTITNVEDGISYTWRVPGMAKITSGQGTDSITVTWRGNSGTIFAVASNNCGSVRGSYVINTVCASAAVANSESAKLHAVITPNPVQSSALLYISNNKAPVSVSVSDIQGKILWHSSGIKTQKISLPVNQLAGGTYFVKVSDGINNVSVKLIKSE